LKSVAEEYIASIYAITGNCGENGWQKAEALISIAKKAPQLFTENWKQINNEINRLHTDTHSDGCSDGNWHSRRNHKTAASKGLEFPPYPFDD
jgi:hypothetical protein